MLLKSKSVFLNKLSKLTSTPEDFKDRTLHLFLFHRRRGRAVPADGCPAHDPPADGTRFSKKPTDSGREVGQKPNVIGPHIGIDIKRHQKSREEEPQGKIEKIRQRVG